jgi:hypothetical protein
LPLVFQPCDLNERVVQNQSGINNSLNPAAGSSYENPGYTKNSVNPADKLPPVQDLAETAAAERRAAGTTLSHFNRSTYRIHIPTSLVEPSYITGTSFVAGAFPRPEFKGNHTVGSPERIYKPALLPNEQPPLIIFSP